MGRSSPLATAVWRVWKQRPAAFVLGGGTCNFPEIRGLAGNPHLGFSEESGLGASRIIHLGLIGVEDFEVKLLPIFGFWGGWGDFNV